MRLFWMGKIMWPGAFSLNSTNIHKATAPFKLFYSDDGFGELRLNCCQDKIGSNCAIRTLRELTKHLDRVIFFKTIWQLWAEGRLWPGKGADLNAGWHHRRATAELRIPDKEREEEEVENGKNEPRHRQSLSNGQQTFERPKVVYYDRMHQATKR